MAAVFMTETFTEQEGKDSTNFALNIAPISSVGKLAGCR
jgi:hypothetical protein